MDSEDISIQLEMIELKKRKEVEKKQSFDEFMHNMRCLEEERKKLIKKLSKKEK